MRRVARCGLVLIAMAVGCTGGESDMETDTDAGTAPDTDDHQQQGCDEVTVYVDGRDPPQVGDTWTVLLRCDGTTITGPMILRIDPDELAFLEENTLRFEQQGQGEVFAQVGSFRATRPVSVER